MNGSPLPKGLRIGSLLTLITGLFVFSVATYFFVMFWISKANPTEDWRAGQFGPAPYTLQDIYNCNQTLGEDFVMAQHIEFANVMNTGMMVVLITIFGLRRMQKWAWWVLLGIFLWVGLNDALALKEGYQPMVPLIPEIIGLTGLFIARRSIFGGGGSDFA